MISLAQIESWVRSGESETLECKRTTGERRAATQTLCGMLNHRGGRMIFGVEPDGRIIGQMVSDHTVEELAQELAEIEPPVFPTVERIDFSGGRQLLVVTVNAGSAQPYAYRGQAYRRSATPPANCRARTTTASCWNGCTANSAGRTSRRPTGT